MQPYAATKASEGLVTSVRLFENAKEAYESTRIAARWVHDQKLEVGASEQAGGHRRPGHRARIAGRGRRNRNRSVRL